MRTAIAVLSMFAFTATPALAQESDPVLIPFSPEVGSRWQITERRTRTSRGDAPEEVKRGTSVGALTIGAASDQDFDATWVVNSVEAGGVRVANQPELLIGLLMRLKLDEFGAPSFVEDWNGLRRRVFEGIEAITPANERDAQWRQGVSALEGAMAQWNPSHASRVLAPVLATLSLCHGTGLSVGQVATAAVQMPNMLGGSPIDATESLTLVSVDRTAGTARLTYTRSLDPESATTSLRQSLVTLAEQSGRSVAEVEASFAGRSMTHDTRADCVVDLETGVTRSVVHEVSVTMGPAVRIDRREISVRPHDD